MERIEYLERLQIQLALKSARPSEMAQIKGFFQANRDRLRQKQWLLVLIKTDHGPRLTAAVNEVVGVSVKEFERLLNVEKLPPQPPESRYERSLRNYIWAADDLRKAVNNVVMCRTLMDQACMFEDNPETISSKYNLPDLKEIINVLVEQVSECNSRVAGEQSVSLGDQLQQEPGTNLPRRKSGGKRKSSGRSKKGTTRRSRSRSKKT
jgi:hypothetical protein